MSDAQHGSTPELTPIPLDEVTVDPFTVFDVDWAVIVSEKDGAVNAMTISWGSLGTLWNIPQATVFVRPSRHTYGLMEGSMSYSICWLGEEHRETLSYLGRVSGRDEDKLAIAGFDVARAAGGTPYIAQSDSVIICKKMYSQRLDLELMEDQSIRQRTYEPDEPGHEMFIGEVIEVLAAP